MAIEEGYEINILVKDVLDFGKSTHSILLEKYDIGKKIIIENYGIPKNKFIRLFKAFGIFWKHRRSWSKIQQYIRLKPKFSLTWIYEFAFYNQFMNTDIIHIQYGTNSHPVDILKKAGLLKGKLIVSFHGHDAFFPINGFIQNNGYYDHLFSGDNLIVANTPYLAEKIEALGCPEKNLLTIPVPVDTQYFTPSEYLKNDEWLQVITVGRLDPIKGHAVAVDLINILRKKGLGIKFTILGDGQEYQNLKNQIAKFNLENDVEMIGRKSQNDVRGILRKSDVYLFTGVPILDGRRETQGLATLEAQACGLPVLAFNSGGVKFTVRDGETGFLCPEYDLDCLEKKLQVLMNLHLRQQMGQNARIFVEKEFSKNVIKKKWKEIYEAST